MQTQRTRTRLASGNVYLLKGKRGDTWYMRYRLPDGTESRRRIGPAHKAGGRPPEGYFTKGTADKVLRHFLVAAENDDLPRVDRSGATLSDAIDEWLRYTEAERGIRATTLREYRSASDKHIRPAFRDRRIEDITTRDIERWKARLVSEGRLSRRTINKLLVNLNGIFTRARRVWGTPNPVTDVEKLRERYDPGDYDFYTPEEVWALVRAAENETDAALFLTAAFTGLRLGELLGLRWRDVDFAGETLRVERQINDMGEVTPTKGGLVRSVPMIPEVAEALAKLANRGVLTGDDDLVFPGLEHARRVERLMNALPGEANEDEVMHEGIWVAQPLDRSALRRRFKEAHKQAGLRPLRFHDLRHTFGTLVINAANQVEVQAWLGHQDGRTTQRYLHHKSRAGEAQRIAAAFGVEEPQPQVLTAVS